MVVYVVVYRPRLLVKCLFLGTNSDFNRKFLDVFIIGTDKNNEYFFS